MRTLTRFSRLLKAPRRAYRTNSHGGTSRRVTSARRAVLGCEPLERREMLSADGLDLDVEPPKASDLPLAAQQGFFPLEETFQLNSLPGADHTIFLDFDGHLTYNEDVGPTVGNPEWIAELNPVFIDDEGNEIELLPSGRFDLPFTTPPYDIDGSDNPDGVIRGFSDQELLNIQEAFLRVAEDFAPFNINITTEQPPISDLKNTGSGDTRWGIRVVVGGSYNDWWFRTVNEGEVGGPDDAVAIPGAFASEYDTPAFVFEESGYADPKALAELVSASSGAMFGLLPDGNFIDPVNIPIDPDNPPTEPQVNEEYDGHANGLWGPIMGSGNAEITQWSQGEYLLANNDEDDLAIIADPANGFGFRSDDHGNEIGADAGGLLPSLLEPDFANDVFTGSGLIEQNTDFDFFEFDIAGGDITINALPAQFLLPGTVDPLDPEGPLLPGGTVNIANLDLKLELYDEAGTLLATGAPDFEQSASLLFPDADAGKYYVSVTGDGFKVDPQEYDLLVLGYTDYGSLGRYSLTVNGELGGAPDRFEENNTFETAAVLNEGDFVLDGLTIHNTADVDYFLWKAGTDGTLTVDLTAVADAFGVPVDDLDLEVYNAQRQLLAISNGVEAVESVTLPVTEGTTYYILVTSFSGVTLEDYVLSIQGPDLAADRFEPNSDPNPPTTLAEPTLDPADIDALGVITLDLNLHFAGDEDVFEWQAPADGRVTVDALFDATATDLLIQILDPDGLVVEESVASAGGQVLSQVVDAGSVYTIRVYSPETSDSARRLGDYRLIVSGVELLGDRLEPNGPDSPTVIPTNIGQFYKMSIHTPTDIDAFTFTAPSRGVLEIEALFQHRFGDLDVRVTDSSGELVALASTITNNELLVISAVAGETYLIEAYGYLGAIVPLYALLTEFTEAPGMIGDFDNNGLVDEGDFTRWSEDYGLTGDGLAADANSDGVVDAADYSVWRDQYEIALATANSEASQSFFAEPEPPSTAPLATASAGPQTIAVTTVQVLADVEEVASLQVVTPLISPLESSVARSSGDRSLAPRETSLRDLALLLTDGAREHDESETAEERASDDREDQEDAFIELDEALALFA